MLNSHSNKALKNETKLCLEEFCLSCPGLLFCEEDFSWFLPIFAPLLLVSETASPQSLHSKLIFFLSAVLFMQADFIICSVYWCLLGAGKPSGELQLGMKFGIGSGLLFNAFLSLWNTWWRRLTLRIPGAGPVVLHLGVRALSLHHWRALYIICEEIKA